MQPSLAIGKARLSALCLRLWANAFGIRFSFGPRLRVPRSMHAALARRADREGVSLNSLVTAMLAEGLGRRDVRD